MSVELKMSLGRCTQRRFIPTCSQFSCTERDVHVCSYPAGYVAFDLKANEPLSCVEEMLALLIANRQSIDKVSLAILKEDNLHMNLLL